MCSAHYTFYATWRLHAPLTVVASALRDYERYPMWWPQVRTARETDTGVAAVIRSFLPYELKLEFVAHQMDDSVLVAEIFGDLEGTAQWSLHATGSGTEARYEQHVQLEHSLLKWLSPVLRPTLRLNHKWMMHCGHKGLAVYLAGKMAPDTQV
jgi:hypothetical protein